jgi:hypothetical protein
VFDANRLASFSANKDQIENEDSDVNAERIRVHESYLNVFIWNQKIFKIGFRNIMIFKFLKLKNSPLILDEIRKSFAKPLSFADMMVKKNKKTPINNDHDRVNNDNNNKKIAVRNLTVGFNTGEIFGLLGIIYVYTIGKLNFM